MTPQYHIMVVDDAVGDVQLVKLAVAEAPYPCAVTTAGNGREALDKLRGDDTPSRPDLIFLDLNMPQMNGKETLKELKSDPDLATIPVVVLSTSAVDRDVTTSYALGASGYITKPMDMDEFFQAVRRVEEYWFNTVRRPLKLLSAT